MTIATTAAPRVLDALAGGYAFEGPEDVASFLEVHPFLVPLLVDARPVIARYFGTETPARLRVAYDPDTGIEEDTQLVVSITTDLEPPVAMAQEDRFVADWWLAQLRQANGRLVIGVTYARRANA